MRFKPAPEFFHRIAVPYLRSIFSPAVWIQFFQKMTNPEMEEKLREAACFGDIEGVKELIAR